MSGEVERIVSIIPSYLHLQRFLLLRVANTLQVYVKLTSLPVFSTKDDLKYRKPSKAEESLRAKIMPRLYSSLLNYMGPSAICDGSRKAS